MKVASTLLNKSESRVDAELAKIADEWGMRVHIKPRLADVITKEKTPLTQRVFDYYTRSHFDFVLTDTEMRPVMAIEYDGPLHQTDPKQAERDAIKNDLCKDAGLGILRINDNHVTKLYRGMTLLRWIIEVRAMEEAFYEAQQVGQIPYDEPFDPGLIASDGKGKRFPYWLSAPATISIHEFFKALGPETKKSWTGIVGSDSAENGFRLSWLVFGDQVLWARTAVRRQLLDFPHHDLLNELDTCELGILLKQYRAGQVSSCSWQEFKPILHTFEKRYNARMSHGMG
jgi:very-short-patch-repair endonuclease